MSEELPKPLQITKKMAYNPIFNGDIHDPKIVGWFMKPELLDLYLQSGYTIAQLEEAGLPIRTSSPPS